MLDDNNISDISILSGLVNLDTVIMRDNIITDISALSTLANLGVCRSSTPSKFDLF